MLSNGSCLTGRNLSHGADDFRPSVGCACAILYNANGCTHHHASNSCRELISNALRSCSILLP
jgi:hypothetical protein